MKASELAKKMKKEKKEKEKQESEYNVQVKKYRENKKNELQKWIEEALGSFGKRYKIEKSWFAGSDYWKLLKGKQVLVSCVLVWATGNFKPADDCDAIPYAEWQVIVCPCAWGGPHDHRGMHGITTKEHLDEQIALIMKEHV